MIKDALRVQKVFDEIFQKKALEKTEANTPDKSDTYGFCPIEARQEFERLALTYERELQFNMRTVNNTYYCLHKLQGYFLSACSVGSSQRKSFIHKGLRNRADMNYHEAIFLSEAERIKIELRNDERTGLWLLRDSHKERIYELLSDASRAFYETQGKVIFNPKMLDYFYYLLWLMDGGLEDTDKFKKDPVKMKKYFKAIVMPEVYGVKKLRGVPEVEEPAKKPVEVKKAPEDPSLANCWMNPVTKA